VKYTILKNIYKVWCHISNKRRFQFKCLIILLFFSSFAEIISITAIFPFFGALIEPEIIMKKPIVKPFLQFFDIDNSSELALPVTIFFAIVVFLSTIIRVTYTWLSIRLSFGLGVDLSYDIYRRTLYQPYIIHISRNSSEIINGIHVKVSEVIFYILMPLMTFFSATLLTLSITVTLFIVTPSSALVSIAVLIILYGILIYNTKERLKFNSSLVAHESNNIIKNLNEGLSGIRDVIIDNSQDSFAKIYNALNFKLRRSQSSIQIISQVPNIILTSMGLLLLSFLAFFFNQNGGFAKALPSLVVLTLGLQRLMPSIQQLYSSWSTIVGSQTSLKDVVNLFEQAYPDHLDIESNKLIKFQNKIELNKIDFRYHKEKPYILKGIQLTIKKGERIGFIGKTGCGKSTLIDIIMGLLTPENGEIIVDGQRITKENCTSWQKNISHVPQSVFLSDNSIQQNIAFGVKDELIDKEKVVFAAKQAQLAEAIDNLPENYQTLVGERGVQLSGGQCQRIGIARALYKNASIIILDEATSALDVETEKEVLSAIQSLNKDITIIMIAHRLNTLSFCDKIVELDQGNIVKITNVNE
jgi:ATP-binding cassette subfamily B protein